MTVSPCLDMAALSVGAYLCTHLPETSNTYSDVTRNYGGELFEKRTVLGNI